MHSVMCVETHNILNINFAAYVEHYTQLIRYGSRFCFIKIEANIVYFSF